MTPDDVTLARVAFVSAVFFKGFWETRLAADKKRREEFYLSPERLAFVDMMAETGNYVMYNCAVVNPMVNVL